MVWVSQPTQPTMEAEKPVPESTEWLDVAILQISPPIGSRSCQRKPKAGKKPEKTQLNYTPG